jgi:large subunit ribosomal protein L3
MLNTIFATKLEMSQAWSKDGKRLPITKLKIADNIVLSNKQTQDGLTTLEVGYGVKKLKNMAKPQRASLEKLKVATGVKQVRGLKWTAADETETAPELGSALPVSELLQVGDVVAIQGDSKGRGFAGAVKRHGFHGGPKTHGQSDRHRAVGSIGSGTTPGRVWKGKKMPGHYGCETTTVSGLVIVRIDAANNEVWVNGPVPGSRQSTVRINKTGLNREIKLNLPEVAVVAAEVPADTQESKAE